MSDMRSLLKFFMLAFLAIPFVACSNDDEPDIPVSDDGVAIYINAVDMLYDTEGRPAFTPTSTPGVYIAVAASQQVTHSYIERLILTDWNGQDLVVNLDKNGSFSIKGESPELSSQGIYSEIIVNFTDYVPFTLQIIDEQRASDSNGAYGEDGYTGEGVARIE